MPDILPCPFCGGKAELMLLITRKGYEEYEHTEEHHAVQCADCGSTGKQYLQKPLSQFTNYTVHDFRNNPILRAKIEDEYEDYYKKTKQLATDAWNMRANNQNMENRNA